MAAEARTDVHHGAPHCLLRLFDAAAIGLADWSEFDAEVERRGIEVRGLSREVLTALIEGSTREIPTTQHRRLHSSNQFYVPHTVFCEHRTKPEFLCVCRLATIRSLTTFNDQNVTFAVVRSLAGASPSVPAALE